MFFNVQFIIRSICTVLFLILTNIFVQGRTTERYTCAIPSLVFVIVELQLTNKSSNYCVRLWICTYMNKTMSINKTFNTICQHVLVLTTCIKQEERSVRVRIYNY